MAEANVVERERPVHRLPRCESPTANHQRSMVNG
jgi:hypothetical protein